MAAQSLRAGQEVHNTYGEHSNGQLLNKHGFTLRSNPFDVVEVSVLCAPGYHTRGYVCRCPKQTSSQRPKRISAKRRGALGLPFCKRTGFRVVAYCNRVLV